MKPCLHHSFPTGAAGGSGGGSPPSVVDLQLPTGYHDLFTQPIATHVFPLSPATHASCT